MAPRKTGSSSPLARLPGLYALALSVFSPQQEEAPERRVWSNADWVSALTCQPGTLARRKHYVPLPVASLRSHF